MPSSEVLAVQLSIQDNNRKVSKVIRLGFSMSPIAQTQNRKHRI